MGPIRIPRQRSRDPDTGIVYPWEVPDLLLGAYLERQERRRTRLMKTLSVEQSGDGNSLRSPAPRSSIALHSDPGGVS
jgi:hypothetical protein